MVLQLLILLQILIVYKILKQGFISVLKISFLWEQAKIVRVMLIAQLTTKGQLQNAIALIRALARNVTSWLLIKSIKITSKQ